MTTALDRRLNSGVILNERGLHIGKVSLGMYIIMDESFRCGDTSLPLVFKFGQMVASSHEQEQLQFGHEILL